MKIRISNIRDLNFLQQVTRYKIFIAEVRHICVGQIFSNKEICHALINQQPCLMNQPILTHYTVHIGENCCTCCSVREKVKVIRMTAWKYSEAILKISLGEIFILSSLEIDNFSLHLKISC